ncbi:tRNA lysidine(34) synthetase TilS [Acaryochloris sp. IP29b_bin.137]|uniref:tRNA lysidine(34) synthetase TilS n=1 Tax=Acaryochloris sp. IP29b_bin.137 TaxID=2969217 RepID=UPI00262C85F2|nr:tRNA lysidine(34) synthetase TilS [Acaryochloris sp. IP29b_bin.137]
MRQSERWTPLHTQLHQVLRQRQFLPPHSKVLLAFSGGQDSFCLLQLLIDLQPKWGWDLALAHGDHGWPSDAAENAQYVVQIADQYQLPLFARRAPTELRSEAAGRRWRYQILTEIAEKQGCSIVVTAHTASDRAETLLYNLIRGSGTDGLQALSWQRPLSAQVHLVRPLLAATRAQTGEFCAQRQLPIWEDGMNQELAYRRNRIRLGVLPYLKTHFNPQVETALAHTAEILQAEVAFLESETQRLLAESIPHQPPVLSSAPSPPCLGYINRRKLQSAPTAIQRRALRQFLQNTLSLSANFQQVEKVSALITAPNRSRTDPLTKTWVAAVLDPWIVICPAAWA